MADSEYWVVTYVPPDARSASSRAARVVKFTTTKQGRKYAISPKIWKGQSHESAGMLAVRVARSQKRRGMKTKDFRGGLNIVKDWAAGKVR